MSNQWTVQRVVGSFRLRGLRVAMHACRWLRLPSSWLGRLRQETFRKMFHQNDWGSSESVSGPGSTLEATVEIRTKLPDLLRRLKVKTLLDAPCGDFNWMPLVLKEVEINYIGADIVPELIKGNSAKFGGERIKFIVLDLATDELPATDLLLCRDCLFHLPLNDVLAVLRRFADSKIPYLLATNHPGCAANAEIIPGEFRMLNLHRAPFGLPAPQLEIKEDDLRGCGQVLALWTREEVRNALK